MSDAMLHNYLQLPPIARTAATATLLLSIGIYAGLISAMPCVFYTDALWRFPPQIWRLVTSFLITGPQLSMLFDTYFLYTYLKQIEVGHPRFPRREDVMWYLTVICGFILCFASTTITVPGNEEEHPCTSAALHSQNSGWHAVWAWWDVFMDGLCDSIFIQVVLKLPTLPYTSSILRSFKPCRYRFEVELTWLQAINHLVGLGFVTFLPALILAICYTVTQDQQGMKTNYMFINIPTPAMPYAMIVISWLFPGGLQNSFLQMEGLVAAHLYLFLTRIWPEYGGGRNILVTPGFMSKLVRTPRILNREYGTAIQPQREASGSSSGVSKGPLPDSWRTRGPGQRLG